MGSAHGSELEPLQCAAAGAASMLLLACVWRRSALGPRWGTSAKSHFRSAAKMSCSSCGKPNAKARCGGCRSAHYCNDVCQKNHWGAHKGPCKATRAAAPPKPPPPPAGPFVLGRHCGFCRSEVALSRDGVGIKCGSCVRVAYCDEECREAHLPAHEAACAEATLARLHAGEGELAGAEANLKRAMEEAKSELNGESYGYVPVRQRKREAEEALVHMGNYAAFLYRVGRFEEAGALYREMLVLSRRTLGDEHPSTLTSINNLAALLVDQGKLDEA